MNESIKIRPNLKLIFVFGFFSVFLFGMLTFHFYKRFIEELNTEFNLIIFLILCVFLILLIITSFFSLNFFSNIEVNEKEIIVNKMISKKNIHIEDIKEIVVSEIIELYGFLAERTQIQLINNEQINFYAFKYKDFYKLKNLLNYINEILKNENIKIKKINLKTVLTSNKNSKVNITRESKTYNFSSILSFSGLLFYSFFIIIFFNIISGKIKEINDILLAVLLIFFFLFLYSLNTNYFIITEKHLIIKNSIFFWKKECFEFNEIESINIHYHYKQLGKTVVVKTKKFENRRFVSDNLLEGNWNAFKRELKNNGIYTFDDSNNTTRRVLY